MYEQPLRIHAPVRTRRCAAMRYRICLSLMLPAFIGLFLPAEALPFNAAPSGNAAPTYYYEQDFISNPNLIALPTQVAVLTLLPASQGVSSLQQHIVRYSLNAGNYSFCLGGDPSLTSLTLTSSSGKPMLTVSSGVCSPIGLASGNYILTVWHDPSKISSKSRTLFVQLPRPHVSTVKLDGTPKSGYWALQPDPAQDPTGAGRLGRINALPRQNLGTDGSNPLYGMPIAGDWTSTTFADTALLSFATAKILSNDTPLDLIPYLGSQTGNISPILAGRVDSNVPSYLGQLYFDDRQDGTVRIGATTSVPFLNSFSVPHWFYVDANTFLTAPPFLTGPPSPSLLARLQFRFFPASKGVTPDPLEEGEIGFFQSCSYSGNGSVFSRDLSDLTALSSPDTNLPSISSIRVGPNTQVLLYPQPNFSGTPVVIQSDTDCGGSVPSSVGSFQIRSQTTKLSASNTCFACLLSGVDLSASVLDGSMLSGTDLSSANLLGTSLVGAVLDSVNFSHALVNGAILDTANLNQTNWSGTDLRTAASVKTTSLDRALGFAGADLTGIDLSGASLQNVDFNLSNLDDAKLLGSNLSTALLDLTQLIGADLTGAVLSNADAFGAQMNNATLTNANVTGASFLEVSLTGANLSNAHFNNADLTASLVSGAEFTGATFAGAKLVPNTPLTGTQLRAANIQGAIFDILIFNNEDFSGVNFTGASLQKTIFQGVTFGNTIFTNANLTGAQFQYLDASVDFSTVNFNSAILTGVLFQGGYLSVLKMGTASFVDATMSGVTFDFVDLTGADFTGATMNGVYFESTSPRGVASFKGAVLDGARRSCRSGSLPGFLQRH